MLEAGSSIKKGGGARGCRSDKCLREGGNNQIGKIADEWNFGRQPGKRAVTIGALARLLFHRSNSKTFRNLESFPLTRAKGPPLDSSAIYVRDLFF
jgi:hypothetical protein